LIGHQSTAWCNLADIALRVGQSYSHDKAATMGEPRDSWSETLELMESHLSSNSVDLATQIRLSPVLHFDSGLELFTADRSDGANRLLRREYRPKFTVPAIA
jgi:hypothetical protein